MAWRDRADHFSDRAVDAGTTERDQGLEVQVGLREQLERSLPERGGARREVDRSRTGGPRAGQEPCRRPEGGGRTQERVGRAPPAPRVGSWSMCRHGRCRPEGEPLVRWQRGRRPPASHAGAAAGSARWRRCGATCRPATTTRGCFGPTSDEATWARSSSTVGTVAPGRTTIAAHTSSPQRGSGSPTTPTSATAGWVRTAALHFDRRDPLAARPDPLGTAPGDGEVAVGVARGEVAGVVPAVGVDGVGGGVGPVEVPGEHRRAALQQLVVVVESATRPWRRQSDAQRLGVEVGVGQHRAAADLGGAVRDRRPGSREARLQRVDEVEVDAATCR